MYSLRAYWACCAKPDIGNISVQIRKDKEEEKIQEEVTHCEDEEKVYVDDDDSKLPELPPEEYYAVTPRGDI